ncbi:LysR family transcriptional regulator [Rhodobacterales bacterium HKCCE3408]|nr:LysR family transcriptional regulator [Rhodobacterales bacterium HKCCE3408]
MDIGALKIVALVAQHGSFASAARVLDMDPSSVSRSVASTEAALGLRIFRRSTRSLTITEEGETYLSRVVPLLDEFEHAREVARQSGATPAGTLRVTASVAFAHECVVPLLGEFRRRYPEVSVELLPTDAMMDITANAIDLAIRLAPAPKGDLISTRLIDTPYVVCASPEYLATHGPLEDPRDLSERDCLRFALPEFRTRWRFRRGEGEPFDVPVSGRLVIANALSLRRAVLDGLGPVLLANWLVARQIESGALVNLFPDYESTATEFDTAAWLLYPSRSYLPRKVRVMIDFLRQRIGRPAI